MKQRTLQVLFLLLVGAAAASCSTTVSQLQSVPTQGASTWKFDSVDVESTAAAATADDLAKLKSLVQQGLSGLQQGQSSVTVSINVTDFSVKSGSERFWGGAFAGNNRLTVDVKVLDAGKNVVASFEVTRKSNPGGYGTFYNQRTAIIENVAKAIVDTIAGKRKS